MTTAAKIEVRDVPDRSWFAIEVDGTEAGRSAYRLAPGLITFTHTEIDAEFVGLGLADVLTRGVLDEARARGLAVHPDCPYVRSWIAQHPAYAHLVPVADRPRYRL